MKPKVKKLFNGKDRFTGLKYSKTPRSTFKIMEKLRVSEDLFWKDYDDNNKKGINDEF